MIEKVGQLKMCEKNTQPEETAEVPKNKGGRPPRKFTDEEVKRISDLAFQGCRNRTIARIVGCDDGTLKKYFSELMDRRRAEYKADLREKQNKLADKNPAMAIFLGKNELGQADKQEHQHGVSKELSDLLRVIDGGTKGTLPDEAESKDAE